MAYFSSLPSILVSGNRLSFRLFSIRTDKFWKCLILALLMTVGMGSVSGATRYSVATGNWSATTTWSASSGGASGASVPGVNDNVYIEGGNTVTLNQNTANSLTLLSIASGSQLSTTAAYTVSAATITINGTFTNGSTGGITVTSLNVNGTYNHNTTSLTFPEGSVSSIWDINSNCNINGLTTGNTTNFAGQSFGNVTYNCTAQTNYIWLLNDGNNTTTTTIKGNFIIQSTNSKILHFRYSGANNGTPTLTVRGNFSIGANCNIDVNNTGGTVVVTLNIGGNFIQTGGSITESGSGTQTINFNGTTIQTYSKSGGTISSAINFAILPNATVDFGTSILNGSTGTFNLNSGGNIITAHNQGLSTTVNTGSIQVTGTKTYNTGANYTYNGTANQITGNGITGANKLTINNTGSSGNNVVALSGNISITGDLTISNGVLDLGTLTANRQAAGGTLKVAGTLLLGGTTGGQGNSNFPTNFTTLTMTGGTVSYDNTTGGQTIYSTPQYNNLILGNTSGIQIAGGTITATMLNTTAGGTLNMGINSLNLSNVTNAGLIRSQNTTSNPISSGLIWGGTVTFDAPAAQTIPASTFKSLVFSGSGIKTLGSITISNGGSLTSNNLALNFTGDFINNGTALNAGSSPITITGTADQNITGFITTGLISMTKTAGIATFTGNVTGGGFTINGNGGTLSLGTGLTHASTGNVILTAGILNGGSSTLTDAANWINNGGTFSAGTGTVTMTGTPNTIGGTVTTTFNNLTLGNGGNQNYSLGCGQTVNGILNLQNNTLFSLGLNNLTLGLSASCIGSFGNNCRIIADQSGQIIKMISSSNINNPFTFPIGDAGNSDYSPITLNFSSGTFAPGAYVAVNVKNTKHPQNMSPTNFLKRYWTINQSGITSFICNVTGSFLNSDVNGNWNLQNAAEYTGLLPWIGYTALGSNTLTANGVTAFGDFTGMGMPVFTTDVSNLSGYLFTYSQGKGPSGSIQFYVSQANNLADKLTVTAPTDFEVSFDNSVFQSSVSITPSNGVLNQTQIYVRLKAGLTVGSYTNENISFTTPGAATLYVPVSGTVTPSTYCNSNGNTSTPYSISLVNFNTINNPSSTKQNNGYSDNTSQSTNIFVGSTYPLTVNINTTGSDRVYATAWIDWNNNGVFESGEAYDLGSATANGKTSLCPLNVIVPAGANIGSTRMRISCKYNGSITDPCNNGFSGEVEDYTLNIFNPIVTTSTAALSGFSYAVGSGPSNEQTFIITGTGIFDNITVTPPAANFEISTVSGGVFQTTPITLTKDLNNKINSTIYVRLIAGLSTGSYGSQNIVLSSTNSITQNVVCSGIVVPAISAGGGGSYCSNSTINLTCSSNGLTNLYWTGPNNYYSTLPSPSIANATTAMSGTYTVSGNYVPSGNMVINGDFSQQYAGFTSSYSLAAQNSTGLNPEGTYDVVALPSSRHGSFCSCTDHTTGSPGFQLVINGAGTEQTIWSPSTPIAVSTNTNYQFTYWVQTVVKNNDPSPSKLKLFVNNVAAGPTYIANDTTGIWKQFVYNWNSGSSTTANLALKNENFSSGGNDFAIDDIVFQRVYTSTSSVNITVIATSSPASISVTASANPVFSGTNVTFTATPTNGGTGPIYQWSVNGSNVGTNSPSYSYIPSYGDVVSCSMTSNSICLSGSNPTNASVSMNVITVQNYWLGTNSTNWGTASNWTRGTVPAFGDNIVFATTANPANTNPVNNLVLDIDRTIGNLTNLSPVSLVIPPAKSLTVNGIITTNGASSPGSIYIQADHNGMAQNGTLIFPNASSVYATVEMYSKAYCNNKSTTPHTDYKWQYFGIPVEAIPANPTFSGSFVRSWDESKDALLHWRTLSNDSIVKPFYGYEITQEDAKTIIFSGQLINRDFISDKLVISPAPAAFPGQHIFANPYTAAINIKYLNFGTDADSTVYLYNTGSIVDWTPSLGSNTLSGNPGQYTAIPQNTAGNLMQLDVPSMQAMLIRPNTKHTTFDNFTFGISYNSVVIKNSSLQKAPYEKTDSTTDKIVGTLIDLKSKKYSDRMWLFSHSGCSGNFDNGWDGTKIMGSALTPQIFAIEPDGNYQVNTVDDLNNTGLGFQAGQEKEYTLTFTHQNLRNKYLAMYLYDISENKTVDITESGTIYSFTAESTPTYQKRFIVATRNIETNSNGKEKQLKIFNSGNTVFVDNLSNQNGELAIYDMMGRCLQTAKFSSYGITAVQVGNISGAYDVTASTSNERLSKKIILAK